MRSGHHAVGDWLLDRCEEPTFHFDDCKDPAAPPVNCFTRVNVRGISIFRLKQNPLSWVRNAWTQNHILVQEDPHINHLALSRLFENEAKTGLINYENKELPPLHARPKIKADRPANIVILRDPLNNAASLIKSDYHQILPFEMFKRLYLQYCDAVLLDSKNWTPILYNSWFTDASYRSQLCIQFQIRHDNSSHSQIPYQGGGSSFEKKRANNDGATLLTLDRWKALEEHPYLQAIIGDDDIAKRTEKVFGFAPRDVSSA